MKKALTALLAIGIWCLAIGTAIGAPLTGGTYTIPSLTISSGGSNNLLGGTYKMIDIKGQAAVGSMTGGAYGLGLGGIYGEVVAGGGPVSGLGEFTDDPHVRNLRIRRASDNVGDAVIIEWDPYPTSPTTYTGPFYLYWHIGPFDNTAGWEGGREITPRGVYSFSDGNQVRAGDAQVYYRVLSNPPATAVLANKVAVGKVNVNVRGAGRFTFASLPFEQTSNNMDNVIGNQLYSGVANSATNLLTMTNGMYLNGAGNWVELPGSAAFNHVLGQGYLFFSQQGHSDRVITLVGGLSREATATAIASGFTYMGNPYFFPSTLDNADLAVSGAAFGVASTADNLLDLNDDRASYLSPTGWVAIPGSTAIPNLEAGKGYVYNKQSGTPFIWIYNPYE